MMLVCTPPAVPRRTPQQVPLAIPHIQHTHTPSAPQTYIPVDTRVSDLYRQRVGPTRSAVFSDMEDSRMPQRHNHSNNAFGALEAPGKCPRCDERRTELNAAGRTQHNHAGPFGFRRIPGCPRCDELKSGASPREGFRSGNSDAGRAADIRAHFASKRHRSGRCGLVCTYGDW